MAGAISGAYHGIDSISTRWQEACEGLEFAKAGSDGLYRISGAADLECTQADTLSSKSGKEETATHAQDKSAEGDKREVLPTQTNEALDTTKL